MSNDTTAAVHYVSTYDEAKSLLAAQTEYQLRTCGCRERNPGQHADNNCCLWFTSAYQQEGGYAAPISAATAAELLEKAHHDGQIIRPFRDFESKSKTIGICFCCACCCSYFKDNRQETCDKGAFIEQTTLEACTQCGLCVPACLFTARGMPEGELQVDREQCFGCGVCTNVCPTEAIRMVGR